MYQLLTSLSRSDLLAQQLPTFVMAFAIAEMFYKFHSFTLETAAFLGTWFVLDWAAGRLRSAFLGADRGNQRENLNYGFGTHRGAPPHALSEDECSAWILGTRA